MPSSLISSHKLREYSLLADSPKPFSEAFSHFGGQLIGSELFFENEESTDAKSYQSLLSGTTEGLLHDVVSRADLIHLSFESGADFLIDNAITLMERLLPITFPRDNRHILLNLSECDDSVSAPQLQQILSLATDLQTHAPVTLVLNSKSIPDPSVKINHLRQELTVAEILLIQNSEISTATNRGLDSLALTNDNLSQEALTVLLASFAACQFLNLEQGERLKVSSIAADLYLSSKTLPSWVEIQSQF